MSEATANTLVVPIISRSPAPPVGVLPNAIVNAFEIALGDIKSPSLLFSIWKACRAGAIVFSRMRSCVSSPIRAT
jgi:hypothetical protein